MEGFIAIILLIVVIAVFFGVRQEWLAAEARFRALALSDIDNMDGLSFEHYVAKLLRHEGYSQVAVSKGSGDFGVDIVASKNSRRYAIQVKRWSGTVSRTAVSDAVAGKSHFSCNAAMVITNSYLSAKSREFALSVGCEIVDRDILGAWILRYQASGPTQQTVSRASDPSIPPRQPETPTPSPKTQEPAEQKSTKLPSNVLQSIKDQAVSDHPLDFATQSYVIEHQREAYDKLEKFRTSGIPQELLIKVKEQAARDHPADYSTQLFVLEGHVESYIALANLAAQSVPRETLAAIKEDAVRNYPCDFSTQLYVVKHQIESYQSLGRLK